MFFMASVSPPIMHHSSVLGQERQIPIDYFLSFSLLLSHHVIVKPHVELQSFKATYGSCSPAGLPMFSILPREYAEDIHEK